jgi:hypothetical protein
MKVITRYQAYKQLGIIPNIESDPNWSVITEEYDNFSGSDWNAIHYKYQDELVFSIHLRQNPTNKYDLQYAHRYSEKLKELGIISKSTASYEAVYDGLYYKFNPITYNFSKLKQGRIIKLFEALRIRLSHHYHSHGSSATTNFINQLVTYIEQKYNIPKPLEHDLESYNNYVDTIKTKIAFDYNASLPSYIYCDFRTFTWYDNSCLKKCKSRNGYFYLKHSDIEPIINLVRYESTYYDKLYYNPETETVVNGTIYLKTDIELCECPSCGRATARMYLIEDLGCKVCLEDKAKIHSYNTRVPELLKFKATKVKPTTMYLGVELEYECRSESDKTKDAILTNTILKDHAILKSDGSVRGGFEIVTCPATIDIHKVEFKSFFDKLSKTTLHKDSNTGMHVHLSRKPLNMLTLGKMTAFLNKESNKTFIENIAGRRLNNYCNQDTSRTISYPHTNDTSYSPRYNTLNLQNKATVEIRIFSTPTSYEEFCYKIEFAQALADYCSPCAANYSVYKLLDCSNFISWVSNNRKQYPYLSNKLKGII